ncbi:hypothetical protein HDU67_005526 [Dinochytrium kinnereticum]|nr:hypothetical protein HDU67_005526 [Dinochytrium kinnereticum]
MLTSSSQQPLPRKQSLPPSDLPSRKQSQILPSTDSPPPITVSAPGQEFPEESGGSDQETTVAEPVEKGDEVERRREKLPLDFDVLRRGLSEVGVGVGEGRGVVFLNLRVPNAGLEDISFLKDYVHLQTLCISGNNLTDLTPLQSLRHLVRLDASNNNLTHFTFPLLNTTELSTPFFNLQELDLSRNRFQEAPDLSMHRFLKRLCLDENEIESLEGLGRLEWLCELSVRGNRVREVDLVGGERVKVLGLENNILTSLKGVENLTSLAELRVGRNAIFSLEGIIVPQEPSLDAVTTKGHKWLRILDLESNKLDSLEEVERIAGLPMLTELVIRGNPLQKLLQRGGEDDVGQDDGFNESIRIGSGYRLSILYRVPRLVILDSLPVTCEEKVSSQNRHNPPAMVVAAHEHAKRLQRHTRLYARIKAVDLIRAERLRPVVLCGPNGVGKRTLTRRLLAEFPHIYGVSVGHTTRRPRAGEEDGVHYHFVRRKEMEGMVEEGRFLEVVNLFGQLYGTSVDAIDRVTEEGKVCVMDLEIEGVLALKRSHLKPYYIFITVPSLDILQQRLEDRMRRSAGPKKSRVIPQSAPTTTTTTTTIMPLSLQEPTPSIADIESETADASPDAPKMWHDTPGLGGDHVDTVTRCEETDVVNVSSVESLHCAGAQTAPTTTLTRSIQDDVRQWMAKAGEVSRELEGLGVGEGSGVCSGGGGFFDLEIMNDDAERAYQTLKEFCLRKYWEGYSEED